MVNAAAYTNVDQAESDVELANLINAKAPGVMAEMAAAGGAWFIHYSTDYVFDGECSTPYTEDVTRQPINVYGGNEVPGGRRDPKGDLAALDHPYQLGVFESWQEFSEHRSAPGKWTAWTEDCQRPDRNANLFRGVIDQYRKND